MKLIVFFSWFWRENNIIIFSFITEIQFIFNSFYENKRLFFVCISILQSCKVIKRRIMKKFSFFESCLKKIIVIFFTNSFDNFIFWNKSLYQYFCLKAKSSSSSDKLLDILIDSFFLFVVRNRKFLFQKYHTYQPNFFEIKTGTYHLCSDDNIRFFYIFESIFFFADIFYTIKIKAKNTRLRKNFFYISFDLFCSYSNGFKIGRMTKRTF